MSAKLTRPLPSSDDTSVFPASDLARGPAPGVAGNPVARWADLFGSTAPERMPTFVAHAVAWQEQMLVHGDVPPHIQRDLSIIAAEVGALRTNSSGKATVGNTAQSVHEALFEKPGGASCAPARTKMSAPLPPASSQLLPGTRLVKSHGGKTHVVEVTASGMLYEGKEFASLSAVAKAITGTHWNGLLFFGLRKRKTYPAKAA